MIHTGTESKDHENSILSGIMDLIGKKNHSSSENMQKQDNVTQGIHDDAQNKEELGTNPMFEDIARKMEKFMSEGGKKVY